MSHDNLLQSMFNTHYGALVALAALNDAQSVGRAAECLNISQPSMSKLLMELRKEFNDPLYTKCNNLFTLTPVGETLCAIVRNTLYTSQSMIEQLRCGVKHRYNICLPHWFNIQEVSALIGNIRTLYPNLVINFRPPSSSTAEDIVQSLKQGTVDVAVRHFPHASPSGIHLKTLGTSEFIFLRRTHASQPPTPPMRQLNREQWLNSPLIIYNISPYLWESFLQANRLNEGLLNITLTLTNNFRRWLDQLVDDDTLLVTLRSTGDPLIASGEYQAVAIPNLRLTYPYHLMWHERAAHDPVHQLIRKALSAMSDHASPSDA
ncbi:LysR family transcriptional regulator [Edwardsiella hoshinae]|uniref:LysR family transcriptional regulator n=1 Tax=Edwardsiella hoshinae TaxID=93378 RepID=A0A376D802_9GAMM|nr:LysR family transcriptional regulator [Edwardsiella hoshinae]AOV95890.1 LysR family transcriptional regulator [Edwardsiella hoshinae]QPR28286.1 LysR family transcriptional regulator [Edwardsiella hoshinae]STC84078.1 Symbiotic regulator homolog 1 [Edwardsiella hoshinae]